MNKTLLPQNYNKMIEDIKTNVGRSSFDLSHSVTFPIDVDGALLPISCFETVPGDAFEISVECLLRQLSPLKVPPMARFQLNTAWYYCDNRLAWKKFERFMTGGKSGNETYDIPVLYNFFREYSGSPSARVLTDISQTESTPVHECSNINYKNTLHTYFNISHNIKFNNYPSYDQVKQLENNDLPLAFPFFDYQMIKRNFYTNIDRLPQNIDTTNYQYYNYDNPFSDWAYENVFPSDDDEIKLIDGPQSKSGYFTQGETISQRKRGFVLDKVRYHDVREDYFTSSVPAPMRGDIPTIDTTVAVGDIDWSDVIALEDEPPSGTKGKFLAIANQGTPQNPDNKLYAATNIYNESGTSFIPDTYFQASSYGAQTTSSKNALNEALSKVKLNLETVKAINMAELRLLSQLTIWQELNMLHKPMYNDFLNAHFNGVKVGEEALETPIYIGGTSQNISINEILQTSASTESSALGTQGATAMSLANNYVGKIYCNNYGYIIGIAYIITDLLYNPAMPKGFSKRTKE